MKYNIDILATAKKLIQEQIDSLYRLSESLGSNFSQVVKTIYNCKGRLIIIGLGKSGIIGKKISSTLNSTGTLSFFIHASDALHGDLGNINQGDIVLFISNSGNTEELKQLLPIIKQMRIKTITMTGNMNSYLAQNSDLLLNVSILKEACPNNLAPTTSTTMQLVTGDSLAVCLLKMKNFSRADFAKWHPAGSLGKQLNLDVSYLCDKSNRPEVNINARLDEVIMEISSKRMGATAVIDDKKIVGIITDGDLRRMLAIKTDIKSIFAHNLMTKKPKTVQKQLLLSNAFGIMKENNITQLIVEEENSYICMIHLHDILKNGIF